MYPHISFFTFSPPLPILLTRIPLPSIAFAECAAGRTFSISYACRDANRLMNGCKKAHATQAEQDAAREEWFARRAERARERERRNRRKAEQERFIREWWGLPEKERRQAELEAAARGERIGGFAAGKGKPAEGS